MTKPIHEEPLATIYQGDCVEVMGGMSENAIDAIVTDPPYGLEFMGKEWDRLDKAHMRQHRASELVDSVKAKYLRHSVEYVGGAAAGKWHETWSHAALRILKPGAHLLAFGGTRTHHRLMCALEDSGLEIRDCLMWLYGSGFPKSLDVSKAIDKAAGIERPRVPGTMGSNNTYSRGAYKLGEAISGEAIRWSGWGTALKPAWEPIVLARKPLAEANVSANVLKWGTGAINVDACRIGNLGGHLFVGLKPGADHTSVTAFGDGLNGKMTEPGNFGRWPANLVLDEEAAAILDEQRFADKTRHTWGAFNGEENPNGIGGSSGPVSRFFYTSKADREDRDGSKHPTVKPVDLMKWLIRLVTPPGGVVLDPFLGSGTTVYAARALGFRSIGIERDGTSCADSVRRLRQGVLL